MPLSWIISKLSLNYVFFFSVYSNVFLFLNVFLISSRRVSQSFWLFQSGLVDSQPCYTGQCLLSSPKRSLAPLSRLHPPFPGTPVLRFLGLNPCCGVSSSSSLLKKRQRESLHVRKSLSSILIPDWHSSWNQTSRWGSFFLRMWKDLLHSLVAPKVAMEILMPFRFFYK